MTRAEAVDAGSRRLDAAGLPHAEARLDAELLLRHAGGWTRAAYVADLRAEVAANVAVVYERLLARRAQREPVAYIVGRQEFWGLDFLVTTAVLIPRPETELIVEDALAWAGARHADLDPPHIVDVGTGSGCLAVTLGRELPTARITAVEVSLEALAVAEANAERHGLRERIHFVHGSLLESVVDDPDLIVANPPYVAERDRSTLPPEVAGYEPALALFGGVDGLQVTRALLETAARRLRPEGHLIVEIGAGQADAVRMLVDAHPALQLIRVREDLQRIPRTVVCRRARRVEITPTRSRRAPGTPE